MNKNFDTLINLLEEADKMQQELIHDIDDLLSENLHNQLNNMIDTIEELKNETD
jgi:hypothetical protein